MNIPWNNWPQFSVKVLLAIAGNEWDSVGTYSTHNNRYLDLVETVYPWVQFDYEPPSPSSKQWKGKLFADRAAAYDLSRVNRKTGRELNGLMEKDYLSPLLEFNRSVFSKPRLIYSEELLESVINKTMRKRLTNGPACYVDVHKRELNVVRIGEAGNATTRRDSNDYARAMALVTTSKIAAHRTESQLFKKVESHKGVRRSGPSVFAFPPSLDAVDEMRKLIRLHAHEFDQEFRLVVWNEDWDANEIRTELYDVELLNANQENRL
jgi:hypothetical protein